MCININISTTILPTTYVCITTCTVDWHHLLFGIHCKQPVICNCKNTYKLFCAHLITKYSKLNYLIKNHKTLSIEFFTCLDFYVFR